MHKVKMINIFIYPIKHVSASYKCRIMVVSVFQKAVIFESTQLSCIIIINMMYIVNYVISFFTLFFLVVVYSMGLGF